MENPYTPPQSTIVAPPASGEAPVFASFWSRLAATIIDSILLMIVTAPLTIAVYGIDSLTANEEIVRGPADIVINWIVPIVLIIFFWLKKGATPGKMVMKIKIVSVDGSPLSAGQCIGRYLSYFLSALGLLLGYLWVLWDPKKQAWHDKIAGTLVVRS